jgi:hypothetical protein
LKRVEKGLKGIEKRVESIAQVDSDGRRRRQKE